MSTPADREPELAAIVGEQIRRMRERTGGHLPAEEQQELAALLEDLLRSHPVLSRWVKSVVSAPQVAESGEVALRAAENVSRPDSGSAHRALEPADTAAGGRQPTVTAARPGANVPRPSGKKPKKAGGVR